MRINHAYGVVIACATLALVLAGCGGSSIPDDDSDFADTPSYSATERSMLSLGNQIDGLFSLDTADETWLAIQRQNCGVARSLAGGDPSSVRWYKPPGQINSALLDEQNLLGSSVAASLVTGCAESINFSWTWPQFWAFIRANGSNVDSRVRCDDGTWSDAGGSQGACSWHGGVDD